MVVTEKGERLTVRQKASSGRMSSKVLSPESLRERCADCVGRTLSICNAVSPAELPRILAVSEHIFLPVGRVFIQEEAEAHDFYVVISGRLRLFNLLPDGRRHITAFAEAGDFIGLAAAEHYAFSAEVQEAATLCRFSRQAMEHLGRQLPEIGRRLRQEASKELIILQKRLLLLGCKTARERVASFLLERAEIMQYRQSRQAGITLSVGHSSQNLQKLGGENLEISLPMPRNDIADYLGITLETVSRVLGSFKQEKLLILHDIHKASLLDIPHLLAIAQGRERFVKNTGKSPKKPLRKP